MRRFYAWLAALVVAAGLGLVVPGEASAAPYCGIAWGSLAKSNPALTQAQVVNVRTGQQPCFDRLVIDLNGAVAGYSIRYVPQVLHDGSGLPVELRGNAFLQVTVNAPPITPAAMPRTTRPTRTSSRTSRTTRLCGKWPSRAASRDTRALAWVSAPGSPSGSSRWPVRERDRGW